MTTGTATAPTKTIAAERTDTLRLFRNRLSEEPCESLFRHLAPFAQETASRENYHRVERNYGEFTRSSALPNAVGPNRVHAAFTDGLPTVTSPKREEAQPKQT